MKKIKYVLVHRGTKEVHKFESFKKQISAYVGDGPTLVIEVCSTFAPEVDRLLKALDSQSLRLNLPLNDQEESCPTLLNNLQKIVSNGFNFTAVIIVCSDKLASSFPVYLLQYGLKAEGVNTEILNLKEGDTVVVNVAAKTRDTLCMPGNTVSAHVFGGATYMG